MASLSLQASFVAISHVILDNFISSFIKIWNSTSLERLLSISEFYFQLKRERSFVKKSLIGFRNPAETNRRSNERCNRVVELFECPVTYRVDERAPIGRTPIKNSRNSRVLK